MPETSKVLSLVDITYLDDKPTMHEAHKAKLGELCQKAIQCQVAAVCVYPRDVAEVKKRLHSSNIPVATVINFPKGDQTLAACRAEIEAAIADSVDEFDVVFPLASFQNGKSEEAQTFLNEMRRLTAGKKLKIIIESGLDTPTVILQKTEMVCKSGADMVKTSTGKVPNAGATKDAVEAILTALDAWEKSHPDAPRLGIKLSGGVTINNVYDLLDPIVRRRGEDWLMKQTRIGASGLVDQILEQSHLPHFVALRAGGGSMPTS